MASSKHSILIRHAKSSFLAMTSATIFSCASLDYGIEKNSFPQQPPTPYDVDASTKILYLARGRRFKTKSKPIPLFCIRIRYHNFKPIFAIGGSTISSAYLAPDIALVR